MTDETVDLPAASPPPTVREFMAIPVVKGAATATLLAIFLLPLGFVSGLIQERQQRQTAVLEEFRRSWGPAQSVVGPILVVPYKAEADKARRYLHFAPSELEVASELSPEIRKRGLFRAVVFAAALRLKGSFAIPADLSAIAPPGELLWQDAFVALDATDLRAVKSDAALHWSDRDIPWTACTESGDTRCAGNLFLVAALHPPAAPRAGEPIPFAAEFDLRGTQGLRLAPLGRTLAMTVAAPWPSPSFAGTQLPTTTEVTSRGFTGAWHLASNAATGRWAWFSRAPIAADADWAAAHEADSQIGVDLIEALPTYQMVDRAAKYAILFLAMSFLSYFLIETIAGMRIHLAQYALLGLSIALFPLLLISWAEPLGFTAGYFLSTLLVVLQASLYTATVARSARLAGIFAAVLAALYAFLYVVLSMESYSLLTGTLALFIALSVVMAVTRRVNWSSGWTRAVGGQ